MRRPTLSSDSTVRSFIEQWRCNPTFTATFDDFIQFEFGFKKIYFAWRLATLVLYTILVLMLAWLEGPGVTGSLPDSALMHGWLGWLLMWSLMTEVPLLGSYICGCRRQPKVQEELPKSVRVMWVAYRAIYPNVFACSFMYKTIFYEYDFDIREKDWLHNVIVYNSAVHVLTTATPSNLTVVSSLMPLALTMAHVIFSVMWQVMVPYFTPKAPPPLYIYLDWNDGPTAIGVSVMWLLVTQLAYCLMALLAGMRRRLFYVLRESIEDLPSHPDNQGIPPQDLQDPGTPPHAPYSRQPYPIEGERSTSPPAFVAQPPPYYSNQPAAVEPYAQQSPRNPYGTAPRERMGLQPDKRYPY